MQAVRSDIALLEQNGITGVALPRLNDPSVIPLWFGEGDQVTADFIRESAKASIDEGETFYVHTRGMPDLRSAIVDYLDQLYSVSLHEDRVSVPGSSMMGVTIAAQMALSQGDDAVIVSPHWPNIETTCRVAGANIIIARQRETADGWELTAQEIIDSCTPKTKCIFVNTPCNPTGWVMVRQEQQALLDYCRENDVLLIADEVYHRHFFTGEAAPSFVEIADDEDPVVIVNGFSKAWAMTGWRVGWVVAPASQATHWAILSECFNTGATVFAQRAAIDALRYGEGEVARLKQQYEKGRQLVVDAFRDHPNVQLTAPEGAFYAFPGITGLSSSRRFAELLLEEEDVGVAPGYTFGPGNDEHIRICYALGHDRLEEGLSRILRFIDRHGNNL